MKIQGKEVTLNDNYLDPVTYVPRYVDGDCSHSACEPGVIISVKDSGIGVLYCRSRTVQMTNPEDLVWG